VIKVLKKSSVENIQYKILPTKHLVNFFMYKIVFFLKYMYIGWYLVHENNSVSTKIQTSIK